MKTISKLFLLLLAFVSCANLAAETTLFSENFGSPSATTLITAYSGWQNTTCSFTGTADVRTTSASTTTAYSAASGSGNVFITYGKTFQVSGISTAGYSNIKISLGFLTAATAATADSVSFLVSSNGTDWSALTLTAMPTNTSWAYYTLNGTVPATSTLSFKVVNNSTKKCQFRIDDIKIVGTGAAIPTLTTSTSAMSYTTLTALERADTLSVTGSDLTENISLALSGTNANMFSLSSSSVTASGTTKVAVRYLPTAEGDHTATLTISSSGITKQISLSGKAYTASSAWVEDFETGVKATYSIDTITCTKGDWDLSDVLIGTSTSDKYLGKQSIRFKNKDAYAAMNFDKDKGAGVLTIYASLYASHANVCKWVLSMSTNGGSSWTQVGDTVSTTSASMTPVNFTINQTGNVRFKITKTNASNDNTLNVDNITITDYTGTSSFLNAVVGVATIKAFSNRVDVNLMEANLVNIYNVNGLLVESKMCSVGNTSFDLASGVYVVSVCGEVKKVIIR